VHGLVFTRLRRVRYWHFLLLWLLMSALWIVLSVDPGQPTAVTLDRHTLSDVDEIINSSFELWLPTWIAVTIFYFIVRRPVTPEQVDETA
jgi:hypothetical protein